MCFNTNKEMISVESLNIRYNRTLLLAIGLWPYQQSKLVQFQSVLLFVILGTFVVFQFTIFLTSKCNIDLIINVFATALCHVIFMIQYSAFKFNIETIRYLLEQLQHIYDELRDKNEIIIIRKCGNSVRCYTIAFTLLAILALFILILYIFWPQILDMVLPMKKSRPYPSPLFTTEYFVDQEKYFYLIIFHANAAFCIGLTTLLSTGTLTLMIFLYAYGMFQIASYRINNVKRQEENETLVHKQLVYAMDIHRRAKKFPTTLTSRFTAMALALMTFCAICGACNLFKFVHEITTGRDLGKLLISSIIIGIYFVYLFINAVLAQGFTDHNNDVFATAYNIRWYAASLHVQKMILFILQVGTKASYINLGGIFRGSLESSLSVYEGGPVSLQLLSATVSYFTVLYATRH